MKKEILESLEKANDAYKGKLLGTGFELIDLLIQHFNQTP